MIEKIIAERCNGCGLCDLACPMDVIHMHPVRKIAEIRYGGDCMTCFACELECPVDAVHVDPMKSEAFAPW